MTKSTFSVCLSQAERRSFEVALLKDGGEAVIKALSTIDVRRAEANEQVRSFFLEVFSHFIPVFLPGVFKRGCTVYRRIVH